MFEPVRGGTRGGQAEFKWSDVSADKDREHYLGHSINAPTGRWQKNKDVHWYNRGIKQTESEKQEEIRKVKEAELEAMSAVLGFTPTTPGTGSASGSSGALKSITGDNTEIAEDEKVRLQEKEEKRRRKIERRAKKAEKRARKEAKRETRAHSSDEVEDERRQHRHRIQSRSRSRSPRRRTSRLLDDFERGEPSRRRRSMSPSGEYRRSETPPTQGIPHSRGEYRVRDMERERERNGRRWDDNGGRDMPRRQERRWD